jgi:hypothetical protein
MFAAFPTLAVSAIFCLWEFCRRERLRRARLLRERLTWMLWVMANRAE